MSSSDIEMDSTSQLSTAKTKGKQKFPILRTKEGYGLRPRKFIIRQSEPKKVRNGKKVQVPGQKKSQKKNRRALKKNEALAGQKQAICSKKKNEMKKVHHRYALRPRPCHPVLTKKMKCQTPKKKAMKTNTWKMDDLHNLKKLGEGTFGVVYFVKDEETKVGYAVKVIKMARVRTKKWMRLEAEIQQKATHPNIIKCFGDFIDTGKYCVILEFCPMGDLHDFVHDVLHYTGMSKAAIQKRVKEILRQIVSAIMYTHEHLGYIHMDLKMDNVLMVSPTHVKLNDFGCAVPIIAPRHTHGSKAFRGGMCTKYSPPEMLKTHGYHFDSTIDIWAIGCMTYDMLTKKNPFFNKFKGSRQERLCIKEAVVKMRNKFMKREFDTTFYERLGSVSQTIVDFFHTIFVRRTNRPLAKDLFELAWLKEN